MKNNPQDILKSIVWDYRVAPSKLLRVMKGTRIKEGPFTRERLFIRMLERLSWYEILDVLGLESVTELLTAKVIARIRPPERRRQYEVVRSPAAVENMNSTDNMSSAGKI